MVNDVEERPIVPAITVLKNDHYFSVLYPLSAETSGAPSDIFLWNNCSNDNRSIRVKYLEVLWQVNYEGCVIHILILIYCV